MRDKKNVSRTQPTKNSPEQNGFHKMVPTMGAGGMTPGITSTNLMQVPQQFGYQIQNGVNSIELQQQQGQKNRMPQAPINIVNNR